MTAPSLAHPPLAKPLRSQLESAVKSARHVAEKAALAALRQLAVGGALLRGCLKQGPVAL